MNTSYPAKIVSFDPVTQTATIKVCIERVYNGLAGKNKLVDFPLIDKVPVHFPQCAGWSMTFPIKAGDDCLAMFAQRGYDHWLYEGKDVAGYRKVEGAEYLQPQHLRENAISDALAIVGFNPVVDTIPNFNGESPEWRNTSRGQRITLNANNDVEIYTPSQVIINAPLTVINGNLKVNGDVGVSGATGVDGLISSATDISVGSGSPFSVAKEMVKGFIPSSLKDFYSRYMTHIHNHVDNQGFSGVTEKPNH